MEMSVLRLYTERQSIYIYIKSWLFSAEPDSRIFCDWNLLRASNLRLQAQVKGLWSKLKENVKNININQYNLRYSNKNHPTTMSNREVNCGKLLTPHFAGVVLFISFNYFVYVVEFLLTLKPAPYIVLLVIFHIIFFFLLWSMTKSIIGDPGRVPIYWGFFAEESTNQRRRYCLLCHSFKPERCHHCSTCQRCVLNMDHHCPWIANCVGYSNRKYFMLFLFYIILTLIFCLCCEIPLLVTEYIKIFTKESAVSVHTIIRTIGSVIQLVFLIVIATFFKFHVELVLTNSSTLDSLERERNPNTGPNVYNISPYENFTQVFGTNWLLWLIPITAHSAQRGNGVQWQKNS